MPTHTSPKQKKAKLISKNNTHILLRRSVIIYALIVFVSFILICFASIAVYSYTKQAVATARYNKIMSVYDKLGLDDTYRGAGSDVFGEKRPYGYDSGRTFSSWVAFGHNAGREETFADLKKHVTAAGFTQIPGPDYGEIGRQDHYKNADGTYIRVSIETKAIHDAMLYGTPMPEPNSAEAKETGPVYVTIKVNLDDNNE